MTSNEIKAAFAEANISVRVKKLDRNFRICTTSGAPHTAVSFEVLRNLGCTEASGLPGGNLNQLHEIFAYAPGIVRRVG